MLLAWPGLTSATPPVVPFSIQDGLRLNHRTLVGPIDAVGPTRVHIRIRPVGGTRPLFEGDRSLQAGMTTVHLTLSSEAVRRLRRLSRRAVVVRLVGLSGSAAGQTFEAPSLPVTF
jgi:hypothetical protein